jgi:L-amino acid N-acyltransferase YncA
MPATIRLATENDADQIAAIYAPIVRDTVISFEVEPPTVDEMRQRLTETLPHLPWLVCEHDGQVLGYAYASRHRARAAYQWAVDTTVYVHEQARRTGMGRALYSSLREVLALQGYYNAYAGIALPNVGSVGLHEAVGFRPVGVYRKVGYKLGAWHDVGWWQLSLQALQDKPDPPRPLQLVQGSAAWDAALAAGARVMRI